MLYVLKIIFSGAEDLDLPGRLPVHQHLCRNKRAAVRPVADDLSRGLVAAGQILQYRYDLVTPSGVIADCTLGRSCASKEYSER